MSLLNQAKELRKGIDTDFENARVLFWLRSSEQSISDGSYDVATHRLVSAALLLLNKDPFGNDRSKLGNLLLGVAIKSGSVKALSEAAPVARRLSENSESEELTDLSGTFSHRFLLTQIVVREFPENQFARQYLADCADRAEHPRDEVANLFLQAYEMNPSPSLGLRTGVAFIDAGLFKKGRPYLHKLDRTKLSGRELLWLVRGLSRTQKWLDRLRAFDILIDVRRDLSLEKFTQRQLGQDDWSASFFDFLNQLPISLNNQESERYEEELDFFEAKFRDALVESLGFRQRLLGESDTLESLTGLVLESPLNEIALALNFNDQEMLRSHCVELADLCLAKSERLGELPLAVLWPFLLKKENEIEPETLFQIADYFAEYARTPSYGWAALSAKCFSLKFYDAGLCLAKRMLRDDEKSELRGKVIQSALKRSLEVDKDSDLLFWLDAFEMSQR